MKPISSTRLEPLIAVFGSRILQNERLRPYTSARVGGAADFLLVIHSVEELTKAVQLLWDFNIPYRLLGGASNVLISDQGLHAFIMINRAESIHLDLNQTAPRIRAESGALLDRIAQKAVKHGLSGLEWAASLPGTLGGALYGNSGAFGKEIGNNLMLAEILHREYGILQWSREDFGFQYRSSKLKSQQDHSTIILSAELQLNYGEPEVIGQEMATLRKKRRERQPAGACSGSMFKNPAGDFAGRLIEAAGLKGTKSGDVEISSKHANFFINHGNGYAENFRSLIQLARQKVFDQFGVRLELEVELLGDWEIEDVTAR